MFEILMFLFENYMDSNARIPSNNAAIINELESIGFDRYDIDGALHWLDGLIQLQEVTGAGSQPASLAIRHYLPEESERLGNEGKGFLFHLERAGIIDALSREVVIDRIMALDMCDINLGRIRWVVLMVLFNQPDKKSALSLLQDMILADAFDVLH